MFDSHDRWKLGISTPVLGLELDIKTDIDWDSIELDGIWSEDYPDFSDAYIAYAEFYEGTSLSDDQLEKASEIHSDKVNKMIHMRGLYK